MCPKSARQDWCKVLAAGVRSMQSRGLCQAAKIVILYMIWQEACWCKYCRAGLGFGVSQSSAMPESSLMHLMCCNCNLCCRVPAAHS